MQTKFQQFVARHPDRTHAEWAAVLGCSRSHFTMLLNGSAQPGKKLMLHIDSVSSGEVPVQSWFALSASQEAAE